MTLPSSLALALAAGLLVITGCSSSSTASSSESTQAVEPTQGGQAEAEGGDAPASEPVAPTDFGDPATAACALLTDDEAQGFLEFPMTEPALGDSLPTLGTGNCTWSAADGLDVRSIQVIVNRTDWIDPEMREANPDASARWFWDLNTTPTTDADGKQMDPLFDLSRPGPDGLGEASYYGPLGLCVLEGDDLYWCTSAGGIGADVDNPEAVAVMEQMAALVDSRITT